MSKFRKEGKKETPEISTSALPDIVFMLLFFFMVSTTMRETEMKVSVRVPKATELSKLEKKSLVSYIYIGEPMKQFQSIHGTEPKIQLNDQFAEPADILDFIEAERQEREEAERPQMITSIKADEFTKMGIITDVKMELRKAAALNISYSTNQAAVVD